MEALAWSKLNNLLFVLKNKGIRTHINISLGLYIEEPTFDVYCLFFFFFKIPVSRTLKERALIAVAIAVVVIGG